MAVSPLEFANQVDAWVRQTQARMTAVFRESSQRVISLAQSRIPVDTGFARASLRVSLSSMPQINPAAHGAKDQRYPDSTAAQLTALAGAVAGRNTIYAGWTASYVGALESGHSKQAPAGFVAVSALEWPRIVNEVTAEAKARAGR